jgi:DNA-binding NarL/FixJ family response regulator
VKDHTTALYRKLGVRNRAEAAKRAEQLGLGGERPGRTTP